MKNQLLTRTVSRGLPILLAAVAVFLTVLPAAASVTLNTGNTAIEISGGTAKRPWKLAYGNIRGMEYSPTVQEISQTRAYYSRAGWLRLIDSEKGIVIGRWHFPGAIIALKPAGGESIDVVCEENLRPATSFKSTYRLDPAAPKLPAIRVDDLRLQRLPLIEGTFVAASPYGITPIAVEKAREQLPQARDMAARDPLSPFVRLNYGLLLRRVGDPAADREFQAAIDSPSTDFVELLPLSAALNRAQEFDWAGKAYDRAYQNFWQTGNDPRLFTVLIGRLILYAPQNPDPNEGPASQRRKDFLERMYLLTPYGEAAPWAWDLYARQLENTGASEAGLWKARAADAHANNTFPGTSYTELMDRWAIVGISGIVAFIIYIVVANLAYRNQARLDRKAGRRSWLAVHWDRRQRVAVALIAVVCWMAAGIGGDLTFSLLRMASSPIATLLGNVRGPITQSYFDRLPASPARDLLRAQAYLENGDYRNAERLFRGLLQFAESWNNLGVLLSRTGRDAEARSAFEQALKIRPDLHEAELNLGQGAHSLWTELHQKYVPAQAMLAPPSKAEMFEVYAGGSGFFHYLKKGVAGPILLARTYSLPSSLLETNRVTTIVVMVVVIVVFITVLALPFLPSREVTQAPGRSQAILEVLFPGTSSSWNVLGGLVLTAFVYSVFQWLIVLKTGGILPMTGMMFPNLTRAYGVAGDVTQVGPLFRPSWVWLYVVPTAIFLVNAGLVIFGRRRTTVRAAIAAGSRN